MKKRVELLSTRLPESHCPACGHPVSGATSIEGATPSPGQPTVCCYCGTICVFADDLTMRLLTEAEVADLKRFPKVWQVLSDLSRLYTLVPAERRQ